MWYSLVPTSVCMDDKDFMIKRDVVSQKELMAEKAEGKEVFHFFEKKLKEKCLCC